MPDILITGSKGFIGRALVHRFKQMGEDYHILEFDLDQGDISTMMPPFPHADHVFHLAGLSFVPLSWEKTADFYRVNVCGIVNILDYCRKNSAGLTFISAYVYGIPEYLPIDEKHPVKPNNPYMHSKVLAESLCSFYTEQFGLNITVLRPFNIYGPGQRSEFLIPEILAQVRNPDSGEIVVNDVRPKRDFLYINDLVEALLLTFLHNDKPGIYNVGSGTSFSVGETIELIMSLTGTKKKIVSTGKGRKNEIPDIRADYSHISGQLGWVPRVSFREGLKKLIESQQ